MTLADLAKFAGQFPPRVRPALGTLAPALRTLADEHGRALYDLPRAPRPPADTAAPVPFLPRYDEVLIAYQHRDRVMPERHRPAVYAKNGIVEAVVLVDGMGAGTWGLARTQTDAVVEIRPFARLARPAAREAIEEGERLARLMAREARTHGARVVTV